MTLHSPAGVENANEHSSILAYNERNTLKSLTYPNGQAESYRYDENDNRVGRTDANGVVHTMEFDALNRLTLQSAPSFIATQAVSSVLGYDGNGNLLSTVETLGDGSLKTEINRYDPRDRLFETTDRNGRVLKYGYDDASNQTRYTDSDGIVSTREFDKKNRLIKTIRATLGAILLAYTGADELKTITHPNGTETNRTYDLAGRLDSITVSQGAVTVSQRVYTFDANGNRKTQVELNGGAAETSSYEYDLDNRLTKVIGPDQTETYTLDAAGNRKTEVVKNLSNVVLADKVYGNNNRDQLLSVVDGAATTTYLYDGNGNQTSVKIGAAPATIYTWGPRDQLASLSTGEAFEYDSAGHRTAKTSGGNRTLYIWSGDQLMAETNTIGNSLSQVTRVGSLLLGEVRGGVAQHLHQDAFNSVMVTSLADGTIPGRLSYRAFGQVRTLTGNVATPFRFNGYVSDGGDELSSPSRFYSMGTGRFTSMDPAKMDPMNPITGNPFVGMNGNPMTMIDPTGKYAEGGHYYTTVAVALRLGYNLADARTLALYSQLPDEVGTFDAIHQPIRDVTSFPEQFADTFTSIWAGEPPSPSRFYDTDRVQKQFHALTGRSSAVETRETSQLIQSADDLKVAGLAIHRLGDTFAHRRIEYPALMYETGEGHLFDGTRPDQVTVRPSLYKEYVRVLAKSLAARQGHAATDKQIDAIANELYGVAIDSMQEAAATRTKFVDRVASEISARGETGGEATARRRAAAMFLNENFFSKNIKTLANLAADTAAPRVVSESSGRPGSYLLEPEKSSAFYTDAQGQEDKNIENFYRLASPNSQRAPDTAIARAELETSAARYVELQRKCEVNACK